MKNEKYFQKQIFNFLDKENISYEKTSPGNFSKSGKADIIGKTKSGKVFHIEVKRFNSKNYKATILQKYLLIKNSISENSFLIDTENKFEEFKNWIKKNS